MWILPSLGRPERALEVAEATPDSQILLRLHWGDDRLDDYQKISWPTTWKVVIHPMQGLAETLNWALKYLPHEENYGFIADDTIPSPKDWQERLEAAAGTRYIAYPDDGIHGKNLCTHHCIGGDLMRFVGWWALPGLKHSFLDTVWYSIGSEAKLLRYVPDVSFDHRHNLNQKAEYDNTYRKGQASYDADLTVFSDFAKGGGGINLVEKIRTVFPKLREK